MKTILNKVKINFDQNLPFVIYKKPNDLNIIGKFQYTNDLFLINDFTEKGFAFCSFDGIKNIIIPENQSENIIDQLLYQDHNTASETDKPNFENDKINFESLVKNAIKAINDNQFKKVVLSRVEQIELTDYDFITIFKNTIYAYPSAFCYCFYHPQIGLWIGATPEQLLQVANNKFNTVSLAGTQKILIDKDPIWHEKEKQEQQFVTDFIESKLKEFGLQPQVSEPFTARAGNLLHIKTIISANLTANFDLKNLIEILHPTPAVCGLPKQASKEFILKNEGYDRQFYTGFLGELNTNNTTDLFVNLRCLKIENDIANIYVGCGITKNSIPESEWYETVNKSFTMKNSLEV